MHHNVAIDLCYYPANVLAPIYTDSSTPPLAACEAAESEVLTNTSFFHLCKATPQKVVDRIRCLVSHCEDEGKDYNSLSRFSCKLLQTFFLALLLYFFCGKSTLLDIICFKYF